MNIRRTERGWAGHFIAADSCRFRRNTLLESDTQKLVVSTVGLYRYKGEVEQIGAGRYYETMAFLSDLDDTRYYDADVTQQITFNSPWQITELDADDKANEMHEKVVEEFIQRMEGGEVLQRNE